MTIADAAPYTMTRPRLPTASELTGRALESLTVTDLAYSQLAHTRPLVEEIVERLLVEVDRDGSVLLVGPNTLLAQVVVEAGFDAHLWRFGDNFLTGDLERLVRGRLTPEVLAGGDLAFGDLRFDAIVLPFVLEHVPSYPAPLLKALKAHLRRDGVMIITCRNLGRLEVRARAARGQTFLPEWRNGSLAVSLDWPELQEHRWYQLQELLGYARDAGLRPLRAAYSVGQTAVNPATLLPLGQYGRVMVKHWIKRAIPPLRDVIHVTLTQASAEDYRSGRIPRDADDRGAGEPLDHYPFVSIALPTHNRAEMLRDSWRGLLQQTYPADRFEVVLVNDNSTDDTDQVAAELIAAAPFATRYIKADGLGAAGARNLGMREARGEIVAHLDDDCRPAPEWLEEGVRGLGQDIAIVSGPVVPKPEQPIRFFSLLARYEDDLGIYPTSNVFYRRAVALAEGGFDDSYGHNLLGRPLPAWDADLAWRILRKQQWRARFRYGAVAYMAVEDQRPREWVEHGWRMTHVPMSIGRVPELKPLLIHGLFAHETTFHFDLAVVGLAIAVFRRQPLALLPVLYWANWWTTRLAGAGRWPPTRWPKLASKLGFLAARQSVSLASLVVGSIRDRRLVL